MIKFQKEKHGHLLAYYRVVSRLLCEKHKLNQHQLELLLFFYGSEGNKYFGIDDFQRYRKSFPGFPLRFAIMLKKGWFVNFRKAAPRQKALYQLSNKATQVITVFYRQLFGEITIRTDCNATSYYGKPLPMHRHVVDSGLLDIINNETAKRRETMKEDKQQRPFLE